jgi:hypothetical protein
MAARAYRGSGTPPTSLLRRTLTTWYVDHRLSQLSLIAIVDSSMHTQVSSTPVEASLLTCRCLLLPEYDGWPVSTLIFRAL